MAFQLKCELQGCDFTASNDDKDLMLAAFGSHQKNHDIQANTAIAAPQRNETSRGQRTEKTQNTERWVRGDMEYVCHSLEQLQEN